MSFQKGFLFVAIRYFLIDLLLRLRTLEIALGPHASVQIANLRSRWAQFPGLYVSCQWAF